MKRVAQVRAWKSLVFSIFNADRRIKFGGLSDPFSVNAYSKTDLNNNRRSKNKKIRTRNKKKNAEKAFLFFLLISYFYEKRDRAK